MVSLCKHYKLRSEPHQANDYYMNKGGAYPGYPPMNYMYNQQYMNMGMNNPNLAMMNMYGGNYPSSATNESMEKYYRQQLQYYMHSMHMNPYQMNPYIGMGMNP